MSQPPSDPEAETVTSWIRRLAIELTVEPLSPRMQAEVLGLARDVAHGTERKAAPLAAFIAGHVVQRAIDDGEDVDEALHKVSDAVARLLGR